MCVRERVCFLFSLCVCVYQRVCVCVCLCGAALPLRLDHMRARVIGLTAAPSGAAPAARDKMREDEKQ